MQKIPSQMFKWVLNSCLLKYFNGCLSFKRVYTYFYRPPYFWKYSMWNRFFFYGNDSNHLQFQLDNFGSLSQPLLVQSQQWEHQNNVWSLFKIKNKDIRMTPMTLFWCLYCYLRTDFIYSCFQCWLWTSKYRLVIFFGALPIDNKKV